MCALMSWSDTMDSGRVFEMLKLYNERNQYSISTSIEKTQIEVLNDYPLGHELFY
jgi:hypothetical protein